MITKLQRCCMARRSGHATTACGSGPRSADNSAKSPMVYVASGAHSFFCKGRATIQSVSHFFLSWKQRVDNFPRGCVLDWIQAIQAFREIRLTGGLRFNRYMQDEYSHTSSAIRRYTSSCRVMCTMCHKSRGFRIREQIETTLTVFLAPHSNSCKLSLCLISLIRRSVFYPSKPEITKVFDFRKKNICAINPWVLIRGFLKAGPSPGWGFQPRSERLTVSVWVFIKRYIFVRSDRSSISGQKYQFFWFLFKKKHQRWRNKIFPVSQRYSTKNSGKSWESFVLTIIPIFKIFQFVRG